jgi:cytosine/adenosine deaminase-related metal-dependent hydrolase
MILKARWIVDREFRLQHDSVVQIGEDRSDEIDLGDSILFPGLVNAHCHLDYTLLKGVIPPASEFTDWIQAINQKKKLWKREDYRRSIREGLKQSLCGGTTSMVNWICDPSDLPSKPFPMRIWWLWEQILFQDNHPPQDWKSWEEQIKTLPPLWSGGLAPHAPYTMTPESVIACVHWSHCHHLPWSIHLAESNAEWEMIKNGKGALHELMRSLGRKMSDCGKHSPMGWFSSLAANHSSPVLLIHVNRMEPHDFDLLDQLSSSEKALISIVHCPRSHLYYRHEPFRFQEFKDRGWNVCLGTDSLASNDSLSMVDEIRFFHHENPSSDPLEVLKMATVYGARALGRESDWKGWQDWVAIPASGGKEDALKQIINFNGIPHFVMVDGVRC